MELNKIYHDDCFELMAKMPDNFIDLTVTSPPYNVGIDYDNHNDNMSEQEYWDFTESWLKELSRVTKIGGRICINIPVMGNNPEMKKGNNYLFHLPQYLSIIRKYFDMRECMVGGRKSKDMKNETENLSVTSNNGKRLLWAARGRILYFVLRCCLFNWLSMKEIN